MEAREWLISTCTTILDVLTWIYRVAYSGVAGEENSAFGIAVFTWVSGTLGTLAVAALIALLWDALFWALRWRSKSILTAAFRGAELSAGQKMARRFAVFDRSIGVIQRMSGVQRRYRRTTWSQSLSTTDAKARIARIVIWLSAALVGVVKFIVQPVVIGLFGLSGAAVWWVIKNPNLDHLLTSASKSVGTIDFTLHPVTLSAAGVGVAVLTFIFGRLGNAKVRGHQEWLRSESAKASGELAERALELEETNLKLQETLWAIFARWKASLREFDSRSKVQRRAYERELRIRLHLAVSDELECSVESHAYYSPKHLHGPTAQDRAIEQFDESVKNLQDHLRQSSPRSESRLFQAAPWRVVRRAQLYALEIYVSRVSSSSKDSAFAKPELNRVSQWLGSMIYHQEGVFPTAEHEEVYDFSAIDFEKRQGALEKAISLWDVEIEEQCQHLHKDVERRLTTLLLSTAELQLAETRIWSYLHPTSSVAKIAEWLRGY